MSRHDLFGVIHDKIPDLLELDEREALKLFLEHPEKLPSDLVSLKPVLFRSFKPTQGAKRNG